MVCYDVVKDRRRDKLHHRLKEHLIPVQKSVFEGELDRTGLKAVERVVERTIDPETDTVRIYVLCGACLSAIRLHGTSETVPGRGAPRIFT